MKEFWESLPRMEPVRDSFENDGGGNVRIVFLRSQICARHRLRGRSEELTGNFTSRLDTSAPSFRGLWSGSQKLTLIKAEQPRRLWFAGRTAHDSPPRVIRGLANEARSLLRDYALPLLVADCALAVPSRGSAPSSAFSLSTSNPAKSFMCSQISFMLQPFPPFAR
jgi:hypothetical protein